MPHYLDLLTLAEQRIARGTDERAAGREDHDRVIAAEVARRGYGGGKSVAAELGVSEKTVSQAVARARARSHDTLERVLAAELRDLAPRPARDWQVLGSIAKDTTINATWAEGPGTWLAGQVEDLDDEYDGAGELAAACRKFTRSQGLAVLDALLRGDTAALPVKS
ncbi:MULTISPECIES: hypothetical protein [unclassified Streptomyces]|uniref:hypothetical protein n=1 Tax=unclassified Streptomyces TaxID=2593676 RepID=UPI00344E24B8